MAAWMLVLIIERHDIMIIIIVHVCDVLDLHQ